MRTVDCNVIPGAGGDIGKIVLNRPKSLNALDREMCAVVDAQLRQWAKLASIKAVLIASASEKAFCAGGDVRAVYDLCKQNQYAEAESFFKQEYTMNQTIFDFPKPYIAFLDGVTMGGGVGISIHGSHPIATEHLVWAMPETRIGIFPDVGVGYHLVKLPDQIGRYLALTGERLNAADVYGLGIVKAIIPRNRLSELERILIDTSFRADDFSAVDKILENFHHQPDADMPIFDEDRRRKIQHYFSQNTIEETIHNLAQSTDSWSQSTAKLLSECSPLSLKVTDEHLRHCRDLSFPAVILESLVLMQHFLRGHDFVEGIRAAIIDKDHHPQWRPATLPKVTAEMVRQYFC